jgi:hypothetical protein
MVVERGLIVVAIVSEQLSVRSEDRRTAPTEE